MRGTSVRSNIPSSVIIFNFSLYLSIISKKAKRCITAVNEKPLYVHINKASSISLRLTTKSFQNFEFIITPGQSDLEIRKYITTRPLFNSYLSTNQCVLGVTAKQWIELIAQVFIQDKGVLLKLQNSNKFNIKEIQYYTRELNIVRLKIESSELQDTQLSKMFPKVEELTVTRDKIPSSILSRNFKKLRFDDIKVSLDNILISNCSSFLIFLQTLPDKDLNRFMKLWIKESNPNLKTFEVCFPDYEQTGLDGTILFKGIRCIDSIKHGEVTRKKFKRHDGTTALVSVFASTSFHFCMTVVG